MHERKRKINGGGRVVTRVLQIVGASHSVQQEVNETYDQSPWWKVCIRYGTGLIGEGVDWGTKFATCSFYLKFETGNLHAEHSCSVIYFKLVTAYCSWRMRGPAPQSCHVGRNGAKRFHLHDIIPNNVSPIVARSKATHLADVLLDGRPSALPHAKCRHLLS